MSDKYNQVIPDKCPCCGRTWLNPKKVEDALRLVKAGVRQATAARAAGISRQRLGQIIKNGGTK